MISLTVGNVGDEEEFVHLYYYGNLFCFIFGSNSFEIILFWFDSQTWKKSDGIGAS